MSISKAEVNKIAELAAIQVDTEVMQPQLSAILAYVSQVNEVDGGEVKLANDDAKLRIDEVRPFVGDKSLLLNQKRLSTSGLLKAFRVNLK